MIGSLINSIFVMMFGYIYPAYECFKSVEMNKPDIDQLRFWCQYWILVAGLTVCERVGDTFIGWVPMYGEAKLAFFIYLWFPKTKGTTYVYDSFFRPYVAKHEPEIDRNLIELRTRAGDMAILYWQKSASYFQTRVFDILQYIASQSTPPKPPNQQIQEQLTRVVQKPNLPSATSPIEKQENSSGEEANPSEDSKPAPPTAPILNEQKTTPSISLVSKAAAAPTALPTLNEQKMLPSRSKSLNNNEGQSVQIDSVTEPPAAAAQDSSLVAEAGKVTRARLRRTRASSK